MIFRFNPASGVPSRRSFLTQLAALGAGSAFGCSKASPPPPGNSVGAASVHAAAASPSASAAPSSQKALRVGYLPITDAAPLLVAHARGLFEAEGLTAERPTLLRSWPQVAEAFQARQVDVVHLLMPMTIWLRFGQRFPLKVVAWDHVDGSALTVASSVSKLTDLASKTVAVPFWYSIHNVILQQLLAKAGLKPILKGEPGKGEVKLVVMAPPDMPPALANGSIAGFIVADPFNAISELNGGGKILRFTGDVWQNHACCVVVMHQDTIDQRPEWAQKVVTALARAQLYTRENRAATAELLSKEGKGYLPQPKPSILRALSHYDHVEYGKTGAIQHKDSAKERIDFAPFPFPSYTEKLVQLLKETKVEGDTSFLTNLDPANVHKDLVDERFARAAIEAVGGPARFGLDPKLARDERFVP